MPATFCAAPRSGLIRAGPDEDVAPAVYAHPRSVVEDDIACAGLKEPKQPRLTFRVRAEHAQHSVVKPILSAALVVTGTVGLQRAGVRQGRVCREDGRDGCRD
jgi:hypothetical protein